MLIFYPHFVRTFTDLPGRTSLLVHAWNGCNLRCMDCHNYPTLIAAPPVGALNAHQVIQRISKSGSLFDAVLLSGGEFLMANLLAISQFLSELRACYEGEIIVFTNGTFPDKLSHLIDHRLIDGVHLDLKLPFHCLEEEQDGAALFRTVLGIPYSQSVCARAIRSAHIVVRHNAPSSQIRTVCYPPLAPRHFAAIRSFVASLNRQYRSQIPYAINPFYTPEAN